MAKTFETAPHLLQFFQVVRSIDGMCKGHFLIRNFLDEKYSDNIGENHNRCWCLRYRLDAHKLST